MRNQRQLFRSSLSDQHSIKWIVVVTWELTSADGVDDRDR